MCYALESKERKRDLSTNLRVSRLTKASFIIKGNQLCYAYVAYTYFALFCWSEAYLIKGYSN